MAPSKSGPFQLHGHTRLQNQQNSRAAQSEQTTPGSTALKICLNFALVQIFHLLLVSAWSRLLLLSPLSPPPVFAISEASSSPPGEPSNPDRGPPAILESRWNILCFKFFQN